jgi:hypothetical protein
MKEHRVGGLENRELRTIFGPKRDEARRGWRKLRNEKLHKLYFSSNINRMIKSRKMGYAEHIACTGEKKVCIQIFGRRTWEKEKL